MIATTISIAIVALILGFFIAKLLEKKKASSTLVNVRKQSATILKEAKIEADGIKKDKILQAKEKFIELKSEHEKVIISRDKKINEAEKRIRDKESKVSQELDKNKKVNIGLEDKNKQLRNRLEHIEKKKTEIDKLHKRQVEQLEVLSGFSATEAKKELVETLKEEAKSDAMAFIQSTLEEAKMGAQQEAKKIILNTIQRIGVEQTIDNCVSVFNLENDDVKGRIIGREGRNIRAIESTTGVEIIVDDTPEAIILSCFDPVRREVARLSLHKLVTDGRIHPARIEEMVEKATKEVEETIKEEGESATFETGVHGVNNELIRLLGKMKYRTSYGQNVLKHSIEVSHLSGLIAGEIGVDIRIAKRAGLLHDIGKAVDHEVEGSHVTIGAALCRKYKESKLIINAVEAHHGDVEPESLIAVIVQAADSISAARPGARRETLETYITRLQKLEEIANSFKGVEKTFAIQAGRELRMMVIPEQVDDTQMILLAREVTKKIEEELEYPGQIKVNIVRETRAIEYAK